MSTKVPFNKTYFNKAIKTSDYTITTSDDIVQANGNISLILPFAELFESELILINSGDGTVIIKASESDYLGTGTDVTSILSAKGQNLNLVSDNTNRQYLKNTSTFNTITLPSHDYQGINNLAYTCVKGIADIKADQTPAFGSLLSMDGTGFVLSDADLTTAVPALYMALSASTGIQQVLIPPGYIRNDSWDFTSGDTLQVSSTPGVITNVRPSASGKQVQFIGKAITAKIIYFNPSPVFVEVS